MNKGNQKEAPKTSQVQLTSPFIHTRASPSCRGWALTVPLTQKFASQPTAGWCTASPRNLTLSRRSPRPSTPPTSTSPLKVSNLTDVVPSLHL